MSERFTRKDADRAFERLCEQMGKRIATSYNDVGGWQLDYNPTYGGCVVVEITNEHGAQDCPFGSNRRSPREFWQMVHDITWALSIRREDLANA